MDRAATQRKIDEGKWYEGDLAELLADAGEAWDQADHRGWKFEIDVADLTKILTEVLERRTADS